MIKEFYEDIEVIEVKEKNEVSNCDIKDIAEVKEIEELLKKFDGYVEETGCVLKLDLNKIVKLIKNKLYLIVVDFEISNDEEIEKVLLLFQL